MMRFLRRLSALPSPAARLTVRARHAGSCCWAFGALALLAGCGTPASGPFDYKTATRRAPLDVPPDLPPLPRDGRFALPERASAGAPAAPAVSASGGAAPAAPRPAVAPTVPNARIERIGAQRWLAVDLPPEAAFEVVRKFFPSIGLAVEREDPQLGIVETVWAENRAKLPQDFIRRTLGTVFDGLYSTGEQDRFRARVERTAANTSEIFISHRGMVEVVSTGQGSGPTQWTRRPSDPELEAELLQRLMARFAPEPDAATAAATAPAPSPAATLAPLARVLPATAAESAQVEIAEPFDRAWRRVGLALDRGGFTVEDRDRTRGTYFVRYLDPDYEARVKAERGFFTRLFGSEPVVEAQQFRIVVASRGDRTYVAVQDRDGKPDSGSTALRILEQVNEQLR